MPPRLASLSWWKQFFNRRLFGADKLSEEAPLGKKLVDHDGANGVRLLVRLEVEYVVRDGPPDAHGLVRFAGIGLESMLEGCIDGPWHVGVGDGGVVVVHGRPSICAIGSFLA
jgi:hypothetical protein